MSRIIESRENRNNYVTTAFFDSQYHNVVSSIVDSLMRKIDILNTYSNQQTSRVKQAAKEVDDLLRESIKMFPTIT